jgi:hypothetical protein
MTSPLSRSEELAARDILAQPEGLGVALKEKRWADVAAAVKFAQNDVSRDMAMTDPALFRELREQITRFYLRGGGAINLGKLEHLTRQQVERAEISPSLTIPHES